MGGNWSPLGGTEWLRNPDWVLDEKPPEYPVTVPVHRNGLPFMPYAYRGGDFSVPAEPAPRFRRRPPKRQAQSLHDPEWDTAPPWMCRPPYWDAEEAS